MQEFGSDKPFLKHGRTAANPRRPTLDQLVKVRILLRQLIKFLQIAQKGGAADCQSKLRNNVSTKVSVIRSNLQKPDKKRIKERWGGC
jgi:hypothetical protein